MSLDLIILDWLTLAKIAKIVNSKTLKYPKNNAFSPYLKCL